MSIGPNHGKPHSHVKELEVHLRGVEETLKGFKQGKYMHGFAFHIHLSVPLWC